MANANEYDKIFRHLRQAGLSKPATEALLDLLLPQDGGGTRYRLEIDEAGTPVAVALS
jgi:hypothetical protein